MSDIVRLTRASAAEVKENIISSSANIRSFCTLMRSLYTDKSLDTSSQVGQRVRELRDNTRNEAILLLKNVISLSSEILANISDYFMCYEVLEYEEWCAMIPVIHEVVTGHRKLNKTLIKMHEESLVTLKKQQGQARLVVNELKQLQERYERNKKELERTASIKRRCAFALSFIPIINLISVALAIFARKDTKEAAANGAQAAIHKDAATTVCNTLIPALQAFTSGISNAAGFFSKMELELGKFERTSNTKVTKFLHYKVMKQEAQEIRSLCETFQADLPEIKSHLSSLT